jgi:uncharacterized RDD family membrane protein YckC
LNDTNHGFINNSIEFETPENIRVSYQLAGLGSRFIAWIIDQLLLTLLLLLVFLVLVLTGTGGGLFHKIDKTIKGGDTSQIIYYAFGIYVLFIGLSTFIYYGCLELLMHGQTPGKRKMQVRVVKAGGFALDGTSIFVRTIFRVIDHVPLFWVIPFISKQSQRLGDFAAGTIVVSSRPAELNTLRDTLLSRPSDSVRFRFSSQALSSLRPVDFEATEKILERWSSLQDYEREDLGRRVCNAFADRMKIPQPDPELRQNFLEDLLTSEYTNRYRKMG